MEQADHRASLADRQQGDQSTGTQQPTCTLTYRDQASSQPFSYQTNQSALQLPSQTVSPLAPRPNSQPFSSQAEQSALQLPGHQPVSISATKPPTSQPFSYQAKQSALQLPSQTVTPSATKSSTSQPFSYQVISQSALQLPSHQPVSPSATKSSTSQPFSY